MIEALYWKFAGEYGHGNIAEVGGFITEWPTNWPPQPSPSEIEDIIEEYRAYLFDINFPRELENYRDSRAMVAIETELSGPRTVILTNDDRTKIALGDKMMTMNNDQTITSMQFRANNAWFDFDYEDCQNLRLALDVHTQLCFDAQKHIEDNHALTPYTDDTWKTDFDNYMEK